jgi:hypothetical protein
MDVNQAFVDGIANLNLKHVDRAIALLWFYRQTQTYEERTASELASDLRQYGFPKPHVTALHSALVKSKFSIRGRREKTFQIDVRKISELESAYGSFLSSKKVKISDSIIPQSFSLGSRRYLEALVHQINGSYDYGFYDACAALSRRLLESLIIEVYVVTNRKTEIEDKSGHFFGLERLISLITTDSKVGLGRNSKKTMEDIKTLGDTAAHDRVYITTQRDIDDVKIKYRNVISELLAKSGIQK